MRVPANMEAAVAEGSFLVQVMLPKLRWTAPLKFGSKLTLSSLSLFVKCFRHNNKNNQALQPDVCLSAVWGDVGSLALVRLGHHCLYHPQEGSTRLSSTLPVTEVRANEGWIWSLQTVYKMVML